MLRRLRSALILGSLWGIVWLILGIIVAVTLRWIRFPLRPVDAINLAVWTGLGIASGTTFAGLLARLERDRTLETLALGRLALWGILAGGGIPIVFSAILLAVLPHVNLEPRAYGVFALLGVTGAATALGTIALAKRGARTPT
jgi:hypothetical protein